MVFLMNLREKYPQFAQQGNTGAYMQQDAEECWTQLLYSLRERLKVCPTFPAAPTLTANSLKFRVRDAPRVLL